MHTSTRARGDAAAPCVHAADRAGSWCCCRCFSFNVSVGIFTLLCPVFVYTQSLHNVLAARVYLNSDSIQHHMQARRQQQLQTLGEGAERPQPAGDHGDQHRSRALPLASPRDAAAFSAVAARCNDPATETGAVSAPPLSRLVVRSCAVGLRPVLHPRLAHRRWRPKG